MKARQTNRRIRLLVALFALAFGVLLLRGLWLQGIESGRLARLADRQHRETLTTPAGRGTIYDRTGVELALGEQTTTVYADPHQVRDPRAVALAASALFGVDANTVYPALLDRNKRFVYVARFADPERARMMMGKRFAGVFSYPEERRFYPQRSVAASLIGYAGVDNKGLGGLEYEYDAKLRGRPGRQTIVRDPSGRAIDVLNSSPARAGADVFTTIDHTIQADAEQVLRETVSRWGAKGATAVVLDPSNGEVLAMAQAPGYDANRTADVGSDNVRSRAVTDTYEPGSTFKLVTVTAALSENLVKPTTTFRLPYTIQVADRTIHDAEPRGTVTYSVAQILKYSSNIGAITLAEKLGARRLARWIDRFGFGRRTGIDYPGESSGLVLPLAKWSGSTIGNVPIGQGIAVTPVQMASVYAAVANGGMWIQPHLVSRAGGRAPEQWQRRRIMSEDVDAQVKSMLTGVTQTGGTGTEAAIPGYTVAGKTGTAQKPDGHGGYSSSRFVASFVGMVPASKPRLVVLVTVDEPHGAIFGGVVAAPAFAAIAKFDLQYLEVPPDDPKTAVRTALGVR